MDIILLVLGILFLLCNKTEWAFVLAFTLVTNVYGLANNISTTFVRHNWSDTGTIMFLVIYAKMLTKGTSVQFNQFRQFYPCLLIFACFLLISFIYDIFINHIDFISIIQTSRHWILIYLAFDLFHRVRYQELKKVLIMLYWCTLVATIIILSDYYLGTSFKEKEQSSYFTEEGFSYVRGAIPSSYTSFFILLLLSPQMLGIEKKQRICSLLLFWLSYVASMIRSVLVSLLALSLYQVFRNGRLTVKKICGIIILSVVACICLFTNEGLTSRLSEGIRDVSSMNLTTMEVKGNMSFRLIMLKERWDYIIKTPSRIAFGVGNIKSDNFPPIFRVGEQLDTGDIAWPLLLVRLGVIGAIVYVFFWFKFTFMLRRCNSPMGRVLFSYMLLTIPLSFCSSSLANGSTWLFIIMVATIVFHEENRQSQLLSHDV